MSLKTLTLITRVIICSAAVALGIAAFIHNPFHLITAGGIFVLGLHVEWKDKEDIYEL